MVAHESPHRLGAGDERVAAGATLDGITDRVSELVHGEYGDLVSQVGLVGDMLVQGRGLDLQSVGEQAHAELMEADLVDQCGAGLGDGRAGEPCPRHRPAPSAFLP